MTLLLNRCRLFFIHVSKSYVAKTGNRHHIILMACPCIFNESLKTNSGENRIPKKSLFFFNLSLITYSIRDVKFWKLNIILLAYIKQRYWKNQKKKIVTALKQIIQYLRNFFTPEFCSEPFDRRNDLSLPNTVISSGARTPPPQFWGVRPF